MTDEEHKKEIDTMINNMIDVLSSSLCDRHQEEVKRMSFKEYYNDPKFKGCVVCHKEALVACQEAMVLATKAIKDALETPSGILPDSVTEARKAIEHALTAARLLQESETNRWMIGL